MTAQKKEPSTEIFALLEKLEKKVNSDPQFSKDDEEKLHEMLAAYKGLLAVGKFSKLLIIGLAAIAAVMTSYKTILIGIKSWIIG